MDDMASKIQSILSDKDSLEKISELAAMLGLSDAGGRRLPTMTAQALTTNTTTRTATSAARPRR